ERDDEQRDDQESHVKKQSESGWCALMAPDELDELLRAGAGKRRAVDLFVMHGHLHRGMGSEGIEEGLVSVGIVERLALGTDDADRAAGNENAGGGRITIDLLGDDFAQAGALV